MFTCNSCGSKSNIITVPTAYMKCPVCEDGELVLDEKQGQVYIFSCPQLIRPYYEWIEYGKVNKN